MKHQQLGYVSSETWDWSIRVRYQRSSEDDVRSPALCVRGKRFRVRRDGFLCWWGSWNGSSSGTIKWNKVETWVPPSRRNNSQSWAGSSYRDFPTSSRAWHRSRFPKQLPFVPEYPIRDPLMISNDFGRRGCYFPARSGSICKLIVVALSFVLKLPRVAVFAIVIRFLTRGAARKCHGYVLSCSWFCCVLIRRIFLVAWRSCRNRLRSRIIGSSPIIARVDATVSLCTARSLLFSYLLSRILIPFRLRREISIDEFSPRWDVILYY